MAAAADEFAGFAPAPAATAAPASANDEFAGFAPAPDAAAAPVTYDSAEFQRRVGRAPSDPELAAFQQNKGKGFAGDTSSRDSDTIAQGVKGGVDEFASLASGAIAAPLAGLHGLGTLALTRDPDAAANDIEAWQRAHTWSPRTESGQTGLQSLGSALDTASSAVQAGGEKIGLSPQAAGAIVPAAQLAATVAGLGGVGATADALTDSAAAVRAGASAAARGAARVGSKAADIIIKGGEIPAGTEFDASGTAVTSKPATPGPTVAPADDVPAAKGTAPPKFTPPAATASPAITADTVSAGPMTTPADAAAAQTRLASLQQLKDSGLKTVRESAVNGDKLAAATDYASSKLDTAGGNPVADQLANEKQALTNKIDSLVADTGGSVGTDSVSLGNRGETILRPLDDLAQKFKDSEQAAYAAAGAQAKGAPVELTGTSDLLSNQASMFNRNTEGSQLLRGIKARARELGVWDDANNELAPATVEQAERLRQYVSGGAYDPRTAPAIRAFKDALADDVTKAAGSDVYQQARAVRAQRAQLLDNPNGIAKIMDSSGPEGINRKVPVEKIPDTLTRLPDAQFNHVVDTLEGMRQYKELQPQADAALGEIRAHMLQRAKEAALPAEKAPWAAARFTKYLQDNSGKLWRVLKPSELEQLQALNANGHYLDIDRSYAGAAVQAHNLATRGKSALAKHGAAAAMGSAGGFVAGHTGAAAGAYVGEQIGGKWAAAIEKAAERKEWAKRVRKL